MGQVRYSRLWIMYGMKSCSVIRSKLTRVHRNILRNTVEKNANPFIPLVQLWLLSFHCVLSFSTKCERYEEILVLSFYIMGQLHVFSSVSMWEVLWILGPPVCGEDFAGTLLPCISKKKHGANETLANFRPSWIFCGIRERQKFLTSITSVKSVFQCKCDFTLCIQKKERRNDKWDCFQEWNIVL